MKRDPNLSSSVNADLPAITHIKIYSHANDLGGEVWNPQILWTVKYAVFLSITDETGVSGVGECWCFDTSPDALVSFLKTEVCPTLIGKTLPEVRAIFSDLSKRATLTARHGILASAISGVDTALWDIEAQGNNTPLWKTLNPDGSGKVRFYASGGLYGKNKTNSDLVNEMRGMATAGFGDVKMKIGGLSIQEDITRIQRVIDALPINTGLIIDGVYSYTVDNALTIFNACDSARIEAFQSPVPAHDIKGMRKLTLAGVPVMAVEAEYRPEIHTLLIESHAVNFLQVSPIACGGLSRVLELADEVRPTDIKLSLEISSTAVAKIAAAHLAGASDQIEHVEFHMLHQVYLDQIDLNQTTFCDSIWALPDRPGLGIVLPVQEKSLRLECQIP